MVCVFPICTNSTLLGTWKLYEAAGRKRWEAGILFTTIVLMKIIGRPTWWTLLLLFQL
jgi:signal peptidase I